MSEIELRATIANQSASPEERASAINQLAEKFKVNEWDKVAPVFLESAKDESLPLSLRQYCMREAAEWLSDALSEREAATELMLEALAVPGISAHDRFLAKRVYWEVEDDREKANSVLESVVHDPESDPLARGWVRLHLVDWISVDQPDRAIQLCLDQIDDPECHPHNRTAARHALATTYRLHKRFDEALEVLEADIADPRTSPEGLAASRGLLAERLMETDLERALALLRENVDDPGTPADVRPVSRNQLIKALREAGRNDELVHELESVANNPAATPVASSEAMRQLADHYRKASDRENAIHWYELLVAHPEAVPQNKAMAKRNLALMIASDDQPRAIALMTELTQDSELPPFVRSTAVAELEMIKAGTVTDSRIAMFDGLS